MKKKYSVILSAIALFAVLMLSSCDWLFTNTATIKVKNGMSWNDGGSTYQADLTIKISGPDSGGGAKTVSYNREEKFTITWTEHDPTFKVEITDAQGYIASGFTLTATTIGTAGRNTTYNLGTITSGSSTTVSITPNSNLVSLFSFSK